MHLSTRILAVVAAAVLLAAPANAWGRKPSVDPVAHGGNANAKAYADANAVAIGQGGDGGKAIINDNSVTQTSSTATVGDVTTGDNTNQNSVTGGNQRQGQGQRQSASADNRGVNNSTNIEVEDRLQAPGMGGLAAASAGCDVVSAQFVVPGIGFGFGVPSNARCKENRDEASAMANAERLYWTLVNAGVPPAQARAAMLSRLASAGTQTRTALVSAGYRVVAPGETVIVGSRDTQADIVVAKVAAGHVSSRSAPATAPVAVRASDSALQMTNRVLRRLNSIQKAEFERTGQVRVQGTLYVGS